jgi:dihydropteroate synthase
MLSPVRPKGAPVTDHLPALVVRGRTVDTSEPVLMGIVNATPDSFSDAGDHPTADARVRRALDLVDQGAAFVDVGGQSGITGVPEVPVAEEIARVVPVVAGLRAAAPDVVVSVDTYRPAAVEAVLDAGADVVNDISGLLYPEVADLVAKAGAGLVIMHTRALPKHKVLDDGLYSGDVTADVFEFLESRLDAVVAAGVASEATILDPGPDFAKTPAQTVEVLRHLDRLRELGRPLLLALSRKDFVGAVTGRPPRERLAGTLAAIGHAVAGGGGGTLLRVHDVAEVRDYLAVAAVLAGRTNLPQEARLADHLRRTTT